MKINVLEKVPRDRTGCLNRNGVEPEPREEDTFKYLTLFGFNIEIIRPGNIQNMKNPDILISGGIWEVKTPTGHNKNTIRNRFREAANQAGRIVFDLRYINKEADKVENQIIGLFKHDGNVRHMMIIEKNGKLLDLIK